MTARVITVTSGKGGVGKTTATANMAIALASLGNKVCCIDADIGLRNLDIVLGLENRIVYDLVDVVEGRAKLRQAMIKDKRVEELYLIPAAQTRDKTAVSPSDMIRICDELRSIVDYIMIDSPAGIERGFRNAVAPADMVIIVTNPEVSSVRDADRIIGLIEAEGKGPGHLVINRVKAEMVKRGDMLSPEDVIDILAIKLIGLVPEDEGILVSTNRGLPASMATDSRAGQAFRNIARRIMGEAVPFMAMEENKSWTQRLFKVFGRGEKEEKPVAAGLKPSVMTMPPAPPPTPTPAPASPVQSARPAPQPAAVRAASAPAAPSAPASAPASAPNPAAASTPAPPPAPPKPSAVAPASAIPSANPIPAPPPTPAPTSTTAGQKVQPAAQPPAGSAPDEAKNAADGKDETAVAKVKASAENKGSNGKPASAGAAESIPSTNTPSPSGS